MSSISASVKNCYFQSVLSYSRLIATGELPTRSEYVPKIRPEKRTVKVSHISAAFTATIFYFYFLRNYIKIIPQSVFQCQGLNTVIFIMRISRYHE